MVWVKIPRKTKCIPVCRLCWLVWLALRNMVLVSLFISPHTDMSGHFLVTTLNKRCLINSRFKNVNFNVIDNKSCFCPKTFKMSEEKTDFIIGSKFWQFWRHKPSFPSLCCFFSLLALTAMKAGRSQDGISKGVCVMKLTVAWTHYCTPTKLSSSTKPGHNQWSHNIGMRPVS